MNTSRALFSRVVLIGGVLLIAASASADPIYVYQDRSIFVAASHCPPGGGTGCATSASADATPNALFDASRTVEHGDASSFASQFSDVTSDGVRASGAVSTQSGSGTAFAFSNLTVTFDLRDYAQYSLQGTSGQMHVGGTFGEDARSSIFLWMTGQPTVITIARVPWAQPFALGAILAPGRYTLIAGTHSNVESPAPFSSFDVSFRLSDVTPTPEPGTLILVRTAVLALARRVIGGHGAS